jgi:hypothetical protein
MSSFHDSSKSVDPIHSLMQLSTSLLIAECIIEIREERLKSMSEMALENLPQLNINNKGVQDLYFDFCEAIGYKQNFVYLAKIGFEDMFKYDFKNDPSVIVSANQDTSHLQNTFGPNYSVLAKTDLLTHSLNVFKLGLEVGKKKGRIMQVAMPIIGCLFHDFGKSSKLRVEILGEESKNKGYKAHAEVSSIYIKEILSRRFYELTNTTGTDTIEALSNAVLFHHPGNSKQKNDTTIKFINEADANARKIEFKKFNQNK